MAEIIERRTVAGHDLVLKSAHGRTVITCDGALVEKFDDPMDAREFYEHVALAERRLQATAPTPDHFEERQVRGSTLTLAREPADGHYHVKRDGVTVWRGSSLPHGRRHLEEATMTAHRHPGPVTR